MTKLFDKAGFKDLEVIRDMAGLDRVVRAIRPPQQENGPKRQAITSFREKTGEKIMFDKLDDMLIHYEELMLMLGDPDVTQDTRRFYKTDEGAGGSGSHRRGI